MLFVRPAVTVQLRSFPADCASCLWLLCCGSQAPGELKRVDSTEIMQAGASELSLYPNNRPALLWPHCHCNSDRKLCTQHVNMRFFKLLIWTSQHLFSHFRPFKLAVKGLSQLMWQCWIRRSTCWSQTDCIRSVQGQENALITSGAWRISLTCYLRHHDVWCFQRRKVCCVMFSIKQIAVEPNLQTSAGTGFFWFVTVAGPVRLTAKLVQTLIMHCSGIAQNVPRHTRCTQFFWYAIIPENFPHF